MIKTYAITAQIQIGRTLDHIYIPIHPMGNEHLDLVTLS